MNVTNAEIDDVINLVQDLCGVMLDQSKAYLIDSRLGRIAKEAGCSNYAQLVHKAKFSNDNNLQRDIVNAITTQETLFFRDGSPYETLQHKVIPDIIDSKAGTIMSKRLRIWSAASSTGQEMYSIAMTLWELIPDILSWDINILGTDISDEAITRASRGHYARHEIQRGLPPKMLKKYFSEESDGCRVKDELRSIVSFQRRNLLESFNDLGQFDIVFCRNVAIYFDDPTKRSLFNRLADKLTPTGYLFTGSSESLVGFGPRFVPHRHCKAVFYRPNMQESAVPCR